MQIQINMVTLIGIIASSGGIVSVIVAGCFWLGSFSGKYVSVTNHEKCIHEIVEMMNSVNVAVTSLRVAVGKLETQLEVFDVYKNSDNKGYAYKR